MTDPVVNTPTGGDDGFKPLLPRVQQLLAPAVTPEPAQQAGAPAEENPYEGGGTTEDNPNDERGPAGDGLEPARVIGGTAVDVAKASVRGVIKGTKESVHFANSINPTAQAVKAATGLDANKVVDLAPEPAAPTTTAGTIAESVSQFTVGMIGYGKLLKAVPLLQKGGKVVAGIRTSLQGGAAQATVFDPMEDRLSNLVEEHTSLGNPLTEYMAADENDSEAEGRFKNFLEGLTMTAAAEGLFALAKGVKKVRLARAQGGDEAGQKAAIEVADELEAAQAAKAVEEKPAPIEGEPAPADTASAPTVDTPASADTAAATNTVSPDQGIKDYIKGMLEHGSEFNPGYSRDFNLAKQSTTDGGLQTINLMSDAMAPQIDALKGGVQSFEKIQSLASVVGEDPHALFARMATRAKDAKKMAADVVATEEWMLSMARSISAEARRVDNGVRDPALLNSMMDQLSSVVADLKAVKTSAARTTAAGRIVKGDKFSDQMVKALAASDGDLTGIVPLIHPSKLRRGANAYVEYWVNSILSGVKTHVINNTTNLVNTFLQPTEKVIGGTMKYIVSGDASAAAEGFSQFVGIAKSLGDATKMMAKAFKLEAPILDAKNGINEFNRYAISSKAFGLNPNSFFGALADWGGKAVRIPTRLLMSEDEFFKQLNYRANVYAKATREGMSLGKKGGDLATHIESRFQEAFDVNGKGMDEAALHEARIATFTEDLHPNSIAHTVSNAAAKHPALRLIIPFVRTPTNIVKQMGQRTPLVNTFMKSYQAEIAAGGARAAAMRGKWVTGGALWGTGLVLAAQGNLTGRGPNNPRIRDQMKAAGWRPYSIKIGDEYYDYSRLDPFGMALGLAADFTEARGYMTDDDAEGLALAMGAALATNLSSKTYLRGLTETLDAISQPEKKMKHWWNSRVGSHVPSAVRSVAGMVGQGDDTMREVRSAMDAVFNRIPGLSETLPPKRDILGEPIHYPPGLGPSDIMPFGHSTDLHDDVRTELARLSYGFAPPAEKYNKRIDLLNYKNEKGQDAYDRLLELRSIERKGRYTLKERLSHEIQSERYQSLPETGDQYSSKKLERVRQIIGEYHEHTFKRLRKEYPQLDADIKTDERNAKTVQRKGVESLKPLLGGQ